MLGAESSKYIVSVKSLGFGGMESLLSSFGLLQTAFRRILGGENRNFTSNSATLDPSY